MSQIFEVSCRVTLGQDEDVELRDNKTAIQRRIKMSVASAAAVAASIGQSGEKKVRGKIIRRGLYFKFL